MVVTWTVLSQGSHALPKCKCVDSLVLCPLVPFSYLINQIHLCCLQLIRWLIQKRMQPTKVSLGMWKRVQGAGLDTPGQGSHGGILGQM